MCGGAEATCREREAGRCGDVVLVRRVGGGGGGTYGNAGEGGEVVAWDLGEEGEGAVGELKRVMELDIGPGVAAEVFGIARC